MLLFATSSSRLADPLDQNSSSRLAYLRNKDTLPLPSSSRLIDPAPDSSALLAARRSEKIRADKREEKRRLEYDWPKEENRAREKQGKRKEKDGEDQGVEVGHVNFWAGLEKVRRFGLSLQAEAACPR